jgi:hypothetical protein
MNYQYLIIGGGMTAVAAVDGIREFDATGSIGIVSAEPDTPYNRAEGIRKFAADIAKLEKVVASKIK